MYAIYKKVQAKLHQSSDGTANSDFNTYSQVVDILRSGTQKTISGKQILTLQEYDQTTDTVEYIAFYKQIVRATKEKYPRLSPEELELQILLRWHSLTPTQRSLFQNSDNEALQKEKQCV